MHRVKRPAHGTQARIFDMRVHRKKIALAQTNAKTRAVHNEMRSKNVLLHCSDALHQKFRY
jgi:hypothetical protein